MIRATIDLLIGMAHLGFARLACRTSGGQNARYWAWRAETAFGHDADRPPAADRRRATAEYARWVAQQHRIRSARIE